MIRGWIKDAGCIYFMTNTVRFRLPVFCFKDAIHAVYSAWPGGITVNQKISGIIPIMPDHLHYYFSIC